MAEKPWNWDDLHERLNAQRKHKKQLETAGTAEISLLEDAIDEANKALGNFQLSMSEYFSDDDPYGEIEVGLSHPVDEFRFPISLKAHFFYNGRTHVTLSGIHADIATERSTGAITQADWSQFLGKMVDYNLKSGPQKQEA